MVATLLQSGDQSNTNQQLKMGQVDAQTVCRYIWFFLIEKGRLSFLYAAGLDDEIDVSERRESDWQL